MANQQKEKEMLTGNQTKERPGAPARDPFAAAETALREAGIPFTVEEDRTRPRTRTARRPSPVRRPLAA